MAEKVNKRGDRRGLGDHERDTRAITLNNARYSQEIDSYKAFADARRARRKYDQTTVTRLYKQISDYVQDCAKNKEPLTIAGSMLATNTNSDLWGKARSGEMDYLLEEYIALNKIDDDCIYVDDCGLPWFYPDNEEMGPVLLLPYSELAQKRDLMIQEQLERNCYQNKGNPAGSIFGLKAKFDWQEDATPQHVVNQLVIADLEQAKKALQMLK